MGSNNAGRPKFLTPTASTPFTTSPSGPLIPSFGSPPYSFRPTQPEAPLYTASTSMPLDTGATSTLFSAPDPPPRSHAFPSRAPWYPQHVPSAATSMSLPNPPVVQPPLQPTIRSTSSPYIIGPPQGQIPNRPVTGPTPVGFSVSAPGVTSSTSTTQLGSAYMKGDAIQTASPGYYNTQPRSVQQYAFTQPPLPWQGNYMVPPGSTPFSPPHGVQAPLIGAPASTGPHFGGRGNSVNSEFPAVNNIHGLVEDFRSLSVEAVPGSINTLLDSASLPRPLGRDLDPSFSSQVFPMNCSSRYFRLTTGGIPNSQSLLSRWHLPLGAVVCPLAQDPQGEDVPILNFASTGIIRCRRCRTYINPYVIFTDSGRKWRCNMCTFLNDVPGDYFANLGPDGMRVDLEQRPELTRGSVEFIAPTEYMVRPPMPPIYFFLIDVSLSAARSGMIECVARTIKSCLDDLPGSPRTQIGFITYDSTVHFYNMKSFLTQPQMIVVSDLDDVFVPIPDDLLVNLSDSRTVVDSFLDSLPSTFRDNDSVESAFGPALKAASLVMNPLGGKLLIFQSTLPSLGAGRLRLRGDDPRVYGTDKEHALRLPEDPFYKQTAADFTKFQVAVNVYAFGDRYIDIASIGTLAKYTGGQVYHYPSFDLPFHGEKLEHELARDLTRETAWEAVMRIRCGKGVRFTTYHGHFMLRSTDLLALPAVDCDKAFAVQFSLEDTLLTTQTAYFQVALLYTSSSGERRIRVHTCAAPVVMDLGDMYRRSDPGAVVVLLARLAVERAQSHTAEDARSSVQLRLVRALREYRSLHAVQHRLGGRMIYPESLRLLPLYALALCKSVPLRADARLDDRCSAAHAVMSLPVGPLLKLLYPVLTRIDAALPTPAPLNTDSLDSNSLFLYDDGMRFVLWLGGMLPPDTVASVVGVDPTVDLSKVVLHERDNPVSRGLIKILDAFRKEYPCYYQVCHIVRQGDQPREGLLLLANLVEEPSAGTNSYVDWVLHLHRQVLQNA